MAVGFGAYSSAVIAGLDPAIHPLRSASFRWMPGSSPGMTSGRHRRCDKSMAMRVMVLGAGVIGTTSAYYLAKSGHEVVVVDRRSGPALETSFANAGGICPGFAGPWAAPGMPANIVRWLFTRHAPLVLLPRFDRH